nr:MAG TPA_asm: hypothetical protein [Caudoviricetes sp.]
MTTKKIEIRLEELVPAWQDYPKQTLLIKKLQKLRLRFLYEKQDCDKYNSIPMPLARVALMESYNNLLKLYYALKNEIVWNGKSREILCKDPLDISEVNIEKADMVLASEEYLIAVSAVGNRFQIDFCEN